MPEPNVSRAKIPENVKAYAGFYATVQVLVQVEFTDDTLILTPIGVRNERPQEYILAKINIDNRILPHLRKIPAMLSYCRKMAELRSSAGQERNLK